MVLETAERVELGRDAEKGVEAAWRTLAVILRNKALRFRKKRKSPTNARSLERNERVETDQLFKVEHGTGEHVRIIKER